MSAYFPAIKQKAIQLRKQGYSLLELSQEFGIAKSTASLWMSGVELDENAKRRLHEKIKKGQINLELAKAGRRKKKTELQEELKNKTQETIENIKEEKNRKRLACSLLFWAEGGKILDSVRFSNSDPIMIKVFLHTLREGFYVNENKFRIKLHLHEYHDKEKSLSFWSGVTKIPPERFNKPYLKPHTGKRKRKDYKGCVDLRYYDWRVAYELKCIYNAYANAVIKGV